ncbi:asparagine synthase-related protein [Peribacillus sp. SCS-37]|uniref:asparagine synthase-related protein n=1 Tax=Paraperibacillus esterisolvens TaxID=3115296 RepID=UPI00390696BA
MSAITGMLHSGQNPIRTEDAAVLMEGLSRFPANDVKTWQDGRIFLGCLSQWVTPESVGEVLPFYHADKQLAITADAIIDNRDELFNRLGVNKSQRHEMPDSQLILLAYEKWGEECPKYLIGDFAFVIWDGKQQKLFGARDFSGSRTLYFIDTKESFAFCSVIMPLLELPHVPKELNDSWLAEYLAAGGMLDAVDSSLTPYRGIRQLAPSCSFSLKEGRLSTRAYEYITQKQKLKLKSDQEYIEAFQEVFQEAVGCRLRTYRNVGAQLSGGLDSGSVAGFAVKQLMKENKRLHTFSYTPPDDFVDYTPKRLIPNETKLIKMTAAYIGHIDDQYYSFKDRDSYTEIDSFLDIMEMPYKFFENSFWLKGMFEAAREKDAGVLLCGDRGNYSISWGYALDYYSILLKRLRWMKLVNELKQYSIRTGGARFSNMSVVARIGFPLIDKLFPDGSRYQFPPLINPAFAGRMGVYEKLREHGLNTQGEYASSSIYENRQRHFRDHFTWNAGSTLFSKLSLRHALVKRDPTNDIRVIRFCMSLPEDQYVKEGMDRALIRRAAEGYLPDDIRLNQRFRGVQGVDWVHRMKSQWTAFVEEAGQLIESKLVLEYMNSRVIREALEAVKSGFDPKQAVNPHYKILMRSIIVNRFLKRFERR